MLFFPVKGIPDKPPNVMPRVRVPKTERIRRPQQCKSIKGFYCQLEPGLPSHPAQWSLDESHEPRFTVVFISLEQRQGVGKGWLAAGVSWYLLIGQSSSLWLARVISSLIGQSYHPQKPWKHDSGIIMPRVRVPKTERIRRPRQCKSIKGFYCQLEPGLPSHPAQWSLDESPKLWITSTFFIFYFLFFIFLIFYFF